MGRFESFRDRGSSSWDRKNDSEIFWSIRRRNRRSKSVSPEETSKCSTSKFSSLSSDDDDDCDDFSVDRQRRGSSFSISSLASRSSTLSRIFRPKKKSFSNDSLGDDLATQFPDFYVSQPTSQSSPSTPICRTSSTLRRPKFTFRRDSLDRRSTRTVDSQESLNEARMPESNSNGKNLLMTSSIVSLLTGTGAQ